MSLQSANLARNSVAVSETRGYEISSRGPKPSTAATHAVSSSLRALQDVEEGLPFPIRWKNTFLPISALLS